MSGWESSTTEMPWSSVTTTMPGSVLRGASECRSSTRRPAWLRATATFGWKRDTGDQVRHNTCGVFTKPVSRVKDLFGNIHFNVFKGVF